MAFLSLAWLSAARAQTDFTWLTREQKGTVSVHELQIPAKARTSLIRGVKCYRKGDAAGSLSHFKQAIKQYPDFYEAYYDKGAAEISLQQTNEALQSFQKSIDLSRGRFARAYIGYGLVLSRLGRTNEAELMLRRGLQEDPSLSEGYALLSIVLFDQNRLVEAEEMAYKALQMPNPSPNYALLTLAFVHLRKENYRSAVQELEACLKAVGSDRYKYKTDPEFSLYLQKKLEEAKAKSADEDHLQGEF